MLRRATLAAAIAALLAVAPVLGLPVLAATSGVGLAVPAPADAVGIAPKVVIVVGATEGTTPSYRADADSIAAEAIKYTPNVVKVYSPNATWAAVSAAAQGASIFIYLGHGYGFPSPYKPILTPSVHDGMGLNEVANNGDSDKKYYGESVVAANIRFARNAIVILDHNCYSAGSSEPGAAEPTIPVAKQRVDNFASGYLRAGARLVMADAADGNVIAMIRSIFTTHQTIGAAWHGQAWAHHHDIVWAPLRNPAYTADMDPDTTTTGFHRSIVGDFDLTTDEIVAGAGAARTNIAPSALVSPGAASVGATPADLSTSASLSAPTGASLPAGTTVRVGQIQGASAEVTTVDGQTTGWVDTADLIPRDSTSPLLWSMDGATTITPNFDGDHDTLHLVGWFSEPVTWTVTIADPSRKTLRTFSGSGDSATIGWTAVSGGVPAAAGDYAWTIHATDAWGNPALDASGIYQVVTRPIPQTGVLSFAPTTTVTRSSTLTYNLRFVGPVTGLAPADFTITGSSIGCVLNTPTSADGGQTWTLVLTTCGTGKVVIQLEPGTVSDGTGSGPSGLIVAPSVVVDRTAPTATAPSAALRTGVVLSGSALQTTLTWTGSDTGGSGLASYDLARSTDGGSYAVVASGLAAPSSTTTLTSGHTYRFEVRARDKAGNAGAWTAGPTLYPALVQQTTTAASWSGSWATVSSTSYSGGSARQSGSAGDGVSYTTSARDIAIVLTTCAACGQVKVYVDGVYAVTLNTNAASTGYRSVAYARRFSSVATHTFGLVVGTTGTPTVSIDAFEVIR